MWRPQPNTDLSCTMGIAFFYGLLILNCCLLIHCCSQCYPFIGCCISDASRTGRYWVAVYANGAAQYTVKADRPNLPVAPPLITDSSFAAAGPFSFRMCVSVCICACYSRTHSVFHPSHILPFHFPLCLCYAFLFFSAKLDAAHYGRICCPSHLHRSLWYPRVGLLLQVSNISMVLIWQLGATFYTFRNSVYSPTEWRHPFHTPKVVHLTWQSCLNKASIYGLVPTLLVTLTAMSTEF